MKLIRQLTLLLLLVVAKSYAAPAGEMLFDRGKGEHIVVNNRVLANVNGKALTVIDVQKSMDMQLYRNYPEYANIAEARYQYYQMNWKHTLDEMINKELILADAEENKLPVTPGDIRQELEDLFGPNMIENLTKANLNYDEAFEMIKSDMTLRRMMYFRVNNKAQKSVTPQKIRAAYDQYAVENYTPTEWSYRVISIRDEESDRGQKISDTVYQMLTLDGVPLNNLMTSLQEKGLLPETTQVSISDPFRHNEKDVNASYRDPLSSILPGQFSLPVAQKSRSSTTPVYRIFFLEDLNPGGAVTFQDVQTKLENTLLSQAIGEETGLYIAKLRDHYHYQEKEISDHIPTNFEPFILK